MTENKSIVSLMLSANSKKEAEDVMDFTKTLTTDQAKELETLLRGVKIGLDLAAGKTATA